MCDFALDSSTDSLLLVDDRLTKLSKKPDLNPANRISFSFPNGETFTPRVNSQKRNKPKKLHHAQSFTSSYSSSSGVARQDTSRLNSMKLNITSTLARSSSMIHLPVRQFQDSVFVQSAGQAPALSQAQSQFKQALLSRSPSMNNVRVKKQELAALIRTNKHDTPTNIDIGVLQTSVPPQPHRNSLTNNRYQKGSNNIVNLELLLLTSSENSSETASYRAMSLGNASSHSTRVGSDTTPNSNPSSVSNYNVNRSESNTPETSISASETTPEAFTKTEKLVSGSAGTSQLMDQLHTPGIGKETPTSVHLSTVSSRNSSFASADEYPTDEKLSWDNPQSKNASGPESKSQLTEANLTLAKTPENDEKAMERDAETNTSSTICSSDKTVSLTSQDDSKFVDNSQDLPNTKPIALLERVYEPVADLLISNFKEETTKQVSEQVHKPENRLDDGIIKREAPLSPELQEKLGTAVKECESTTNTNTYTEPIRTDQRLSVDNSQDSSLIKQPMVSFTERRGPGLSLNIGPVRHSFVEPSPGAGSPHSHESLPSVLKSPEVDRQVPLSAFSYENSPGNRASIYSPVQIEKFFSDNQKEVPPRGDIVMMEAQKRNSSASSFGSVMPSPKVLQMKSFLNESRSADSSFDTSANNSANNMDTSVNNVNTLSNVNTSANTAILNVKDTMPSNATTSIGSAVTPVSDAKTSTTNSDKVLTPKSNSASTAKSEKTFTSAKTQESSETKKEISNQRALNVLKQENGEADIILQNRLSLLNVVNVDFDKSLPSSPNFDSMYDKLKTPEPSPKKAALPIKPTKSKNEKNATGFRKMFKMFSKSNDSDSNSKSESGSTNGNKKKIFHIPLKLSSRLSPTYSVRDLKKLEVLVRESPTKEVNLPTPSYDLPALEFEEIFFNDVLLKFDEVEKQAQSEVDLLKKNMSIHNLFMKDDELSKDQIANQQQKDAGNFEEFLAFETPRSMDYNNVYSLSEELVAELPIGKEQALVLSKEDIATILDNPRSLTYLFLRYLRQYRDCDQMTVRLTGFNPLDKSPVNANIKQVSILGKKDKIQKNRVKFADTLQISETFDPEMYKRYNRSVTQYYLTEFAEVNRIKNELNFYKCHEMLVHQRSQCNTHFFY